jgi:hypothetical protein
MSLVFVSAAVFLAAALVNSTESYVSSDKPQKLFLTEDQVVKFIQATKSQLCKKFGYPFQPVNTEYITQVGNNYECRFTFAGFSPVGTGIYSLGVTSTFSPEGNLVGDLKFQSTTTIDQMDAFDGFQSGALVTKQELPTINQLRAAFS